jgi:hypothetical protein
VKTIAMTLALGIIFITAARGQGFLNLNFEAAFGTGTNFPGNPGAGVALPAESALPGWTAFEGDNALSYIYYVSNSLGNRWAVELESGSLALTGNGLTVGLYSEGSISQTGSVPVDDESLQFEAYGIGNPNVSGFSVTLGGQTLSYSTLSEGPDYNVYGANIPAGMEGQMETLTFLIQLGGSGGVLLDNIELSPTSVPEPGGWELIGIGGLMARCWMTFNRIERKKRKTTL